MNLGKWASIPLRLGLGTVFIAHGLQKSFGMFGGSGVHGFAESLARIGFVPALAWAYLAAYVELLGGLSLILGLGTRISSVLLFILISVAGITVHLPRGFFAKDGGIEFTFVLACMCLSLAVLGTGKFGLNKKL